MWVMGLSTCIPLPRVVFDIVISSPDLNVPDGDIIPPLLDKFAFPLDIIFGYLKVSE